MAAPLGLCFLAVYLHVEAGDVIPMPPILATVHWAYCNPRPMTVPFRTRPERDNRQERKERESEIQGESGEEANGQELCLLLSRYRFEI
jgi:hypothetical protein